MCLGTSSKDSVLASTSFISCQSLDSLLYRSGVVLEKVCEYLYYNEKHKETKIAPDMEIPIELSLELLLASDFLDRAFNRMFAKSLLTLRSVMSADSNRVVGRRLDGMALRVESEALLWCLRSLDVFESYHQ